MKRLALCISCILFLAVPFTGQVFAEGEFTLTSPQIKEGKMIGNEQVLNGFGCLGDGTSPALHIKNAPEGTKSFVITAHDPDAPTSSGWWHWVIFNIPANVTKLEKNAGNLETGLAPEGSVQSRTDFGALGYGGPCPPKDHGVHHYVFTVHALNVESIPLDQNASGAMVEILASGYSLGSATLTGIYSR